MKIMVLLWSTSVAKDSSIVPSLFFSHFFVWPFSFFIWPSSPFFIIPHLGQCSRKWWSSHFYLFTTQWYNSILEQSMTLYECLRRCTEICNESRVTCMKELWTVALPQIRCQLHDHAKQYDNDGMCHNKMERLKVAWQYISEWLWKFHNR